MSDLPRVLRDLAERGYATVSDGNGPCAALVSRHNVGSVVATSTLAPGVPPAAREAGGTVLLAASSQCIRLLLARALEPDTRPEPSAEEP